MVHPAAVAEVFGTGTAKEGAGVPVVVQAEVVEGVEVRREVVLVGMSCISSSGRGGVLVSATLVLEVADDFLEGVVLPAEVACLGGFGADGFVALELHVAEVEVELGSQLH